MSEEWWLITPELRFVLRNGEKILQQRWEKHFRAEIGMEFDRPSEWRDVQIADENGQRGEAHER